jgi:pyruvate ferredoxin oxidoreductase delta subunit
MSKSSKSKLYGPVALVYNSADTGSWRYVRPGVDFAKCVKCGTCVMFCPTNVMEINEKCIEIDWKYCKGCGICANVCPKKCIRMVDEGGSESR